MDKFPKPISKKSAKKEMLKEIECLRDEVHQQQRELNKLHNDNKKLESELNLYKYQITSVKQVLSLNFEIE